MFLWIHLLIFDSTVLTAIRVWRWCFSCWRRWDPRWSYHKKPWRV